MIVPMTIEHKCVLGAAALLAASGVVIIWRSRCDRRLHGWMAIGYVIAMVVLVLWNASCMAERQARQEAQWDADHKAFMDRVLPRKD